MSSFDMIADNGCTRGSDSSVDSIQRQYATVTSLEVIIALDNARGKGFVIPVPSKELLQRNG